MSYSENSLVARYYRKDLSPEERKKVNDEMEERSIDKLEDERQLSWNPNHDNIL